MDQRFRFTLRRDQVIPPAGGGSGGREPENSISQGIPKVVIEEEPAVQAFIPKRCLNRVSLHRSTRTLVYHVARSGSLRDAICKNEAIPRPWGSQLVLHDK